MTGSPGRPSGPTGPTGRAGRAGPTGPAGPSGRAGPAGPGGPAPAPLVALSVAAGTAGAAQGAVNGTLGRVLGSAAAAALVNVSVGLLLLLAAVAVWPPLRAALRRLRGARLPWWTFLGGAAGAVFVTTAALAVPVVGVSAFTIALVFGATTGALVVDRTPIGPAGVLPVSRARVAGALLGLVAVLVSQVGRPAGHLAFGVLAAVVAASALTTVQVALNARLTGVSGHVGAATAVNFSVGTVVTALLVGASGGVPHGLPPHWWLYLGGPLGVFIVAGTALAGRGIGVLRATLALVAGQLATALLLDALLPAGVGVSVFTAVGAALTLAGVTVAGGGRARSRRRGAPGRVADSDG